nr:MAG TPA: hypothetical protein [Caudoviricetes sp.]
MIFGKKNKEGNKAVNLKMVEGITGLNNKPVQVSLDDKLETLVIKERLGKIKAGLSYEKIINANVITEKEIIEKNKSVIGRAIVGGVLIGGLGAVVGAMSGLSKKQKAEKHYYMVINYKMEEEIKTLSFEIVGASLHWDIFLKELRKRINTVDIENEAIL